MRNASIYSTLRDDSKVATSYANYNGLAKRKRDQESVSLEKGPSKHLNTMKINQYQITL